jgi:hypothetical protein
MSPKYNVIELETGNVIWYEENGYRISFTEDPANSDYQRYLRWLNGEEENGTIS